MATCKTWAVKGRIDHLIAYVENPKKTTEFSEEQQHLFNLMNYVSRADKTNDNVFVTGINCDPEFAVEQWIETKRRYGKEDKILAFHGFQSFSPDEVDPKTGKKIDAKTAHEIGVKWAHEVWGDKFELVLTTHLDREHIHNHIALNSVSCKDGYKYNNDKTHIRRMRQISDRICLEYGLSIIKDPNKKAPPRKIHLAEKEGKMTRNNIMKDDIDYAISLSRSRKEFVNTMMRMGYEFEPGEHLSLRIQGDKKSVWTDHLGNNYRKYTIDNRIISNFKPVVSFIVAFKPIDIFDSFQFSGNTYKYSKIAAYTLLSMYYLFVCLLLIAAMPFARNGVSPNTEKHYIHPSLRLDVMKLESFVKQLDYMAKHKIVTSDDLKRRKEIVKDKLSYLVTQRQIQRNIMKRQTSTPEEIVNAKIERDKLTAQIVPLREELKICEGIGERSHIVEKKLDVQKEHEHKLQTQQDKICGKDQRGYFAPHAQSVRKQLENFSRNLQPLSEQSNDENQMQRVKPKIKEYER